MARFEQDREDILREATALLRRIEVELPECAEPVTIGFRRDGSASFYFGADLVLQFNSLGELRRGYHNGRLIKADGGKLYSMEKHRTDKSVELRSHRMTADELHQFLQLADGSLTMLRAVFQSGTMRMLRQVPEKMDIAGEVASWLNNHSNNIPIANSPRTE